MRSAIKLGILLAFVTLVSGCSGMRSSMQMNSDSRTPFFNFQLPIKNSAESADVRPANHVAEPPRVEQSFHEVTIDEPAPEDSRWAQWLGKLKRPPRIPLPRTDITDDGEIVDASDSDNASFDAF